MEGAVVTADDQVIDISQGENNQESVEVMSEQIEIVQGIAPEHIQVVVSQAEDTSLDQQTRADNIQIDEQSMVHTLATLTVSAAL